MIAFSSFLIAFFFLFFVVVVVAVAFLYVSSVGGHPHAYTNGKLFASFGFLFVSVSFACFLPLVEVEINTVTHGKRF